MKINNAIASSINDLKVDMIFAFKSVKKRELILMYLKEESGVSKKEQFVLNQWNMFEITTPSLQLETRLPVFHHGRLP